MALKIKALRRITDGGHNIPKGKVESVSDGYAKGWINLGWAEPVKEAVKPEPKDAPK